MILLLIIALNIPKYKKIYYNLLKIAILDDIVINNRVFWFFS
jgi:hypothetical protein